MLQYTFPLTFDGDTEPRQPKQQKHATNSTMMNNHQAPSLPCYFNHTSLGSVLETRCRAAIDVFEALQIRNAIALLASTKERAIEAASNAVEHAFRFSSTPPLPAPSLITNDAAVPADGSFVGHLNYGSYRVWNTPTCRPKQEEAADASSVQPTCRLEQQ